MKPITIRGFWKYVSIALGSILLIVLLGTLLLRSPFITDRLLPPVQAKLEQELNLKLKIKNLSIDPFARVALKDVSADWNNPKLGQVKISLDRLLVRFSFWELLNRQLKIAEIELDSPSIVANLKLPSATKKSDASNPLSLIRQLIENPPASLNLNSFVIRNLSADATLQQGQTKVHLQLQNFGFSTEVRLENRILGASLKLTLGSAEKSSNIPLRIDIQDLSPELPSFSAVLVPDVVLASGMELSFKESAKPHLELHESSITFRGREIRINAQMSKSGKTQLQLAKFTAHQSTHRPIRIGLSDIYQLESLPPDEFQKKLTERLIPIVNQLSLSGEGLLEAAEVSAHVQLPAASMDVHSSFSFDVPFKFSLEPQDFRLQSGNRPIRFQLQTLTLKGSAFRGLLRTVDPDALSGLLALLPFDLQMSPPSLQSLARPLSSARISRFKMSPQLSWARPVEPFLSADIEFKHTPEGGMDLKVDNELFVKQQLLKLVPQLKPVEQSLGLLRASTGLKLNFATPWKDLQDVVDSSLSTVRAVSLDYDTQLDQLTRPPQKNAQAIHFPGGLRIQGDVQLADPAALKDVMVKTHVDWAGTPLLKNQLRIVNQSRLLKLIGSTDIFALLRLRNLTPLADQLGLVGGHTVQTQWEVGLEHGANSILSAKIPAPEKLKVAAKIAAKVSVSEKPVIPIFEKKMLQLKGPIKASVRASVSRGHVDASLQYDVPGVGLPKLVSVDTLNGLLSVKTRMDGKTGIELGLSAEVAGVNPDPSLGVPADTIPYLKNIATKLQIQTDAKSRVDIRQGRLETGKGRLKVQFAGGSDLKGTNSRFEGQLAVRPPQTFRYGIRAQDKVSLDGLMQVGWEVTQKELKALRLRGRAGLENFSVQHALGGFKNANGQIPFQQDLELLNGKSLRWTYVIQNTPFKRVDTSKFVPLTSEDSMVSIEQLNALNRKFGPLRGRFSLNQNMLTIDRLDADLFEGMLTGQGFIDVQPSRLLAGLQGRVTQLNTALLSAHPEESIPAPLSARLALDVNLSKSLVEGRVDVTEIGKNQLLSMVDLLDPSGADPLLNKARMALSVGYPTFVGMQMQQGFLDLDVALGGVVTQQIKIPHLPLTPIINAKTQDLVKTLREVPIQ